MTRFGRHICLPEKMGRSSLTIPPQCVCLCEPLPRLPVPTVELWDVVMLPSHGSVTAHCHWEGTTATPASRALCRLWCFREVLKISKIPPGLSFKKNAAKEKWDAKGGNTPLKFDNPLCWGPPFTLQSTCPVGMWPPCTRPFPRPL